MTYRSDIGVGPPRDRLWRHEPCRICGIARFDMRREIETDTCKFCRHAEANTNEEPELVCTD